MSGNFRVTVRLDLERKVTRRYERRDIAAAIAACINPSQLKLYSIASERLAFPYTTACSP
jgi:hypothetical protein